MTSGQYNLINAIALNLVWIAAVAGAAEGLWWAGPLAAAVFCVGHTPFFTRTDALVLLALLPLGAVLDSLYAVSGLVSYASPVPWSKAAPVWILALWLAFGLAVGHSLRIVLTHRWLAMLLGAIFGPLSYWIAADVWGAAEFGHPWPIWISALGISWAGVMALCHRLLRMDPEASVARLAAAAGGFFAPGRR